MTDDRFPIRVVVLALSVGFIGSIAAICWLASTQTSIPDSLSDIPVFAGGALAGILAKTSTTPEAITIDQPADDPIPVDTGDGGGDDSTA